MTQAHSDAQEHKKMSLSTLSVFEMTKFLGNELTISNYLSQMLDDGDNDELICARGDIAKAKGMTMIARESGLGRENLYKALAPGAKPRFDTVLKVIKAIGVKLHAKPAL